MKLKKYCETKHISRYENKGLMSVESWIRTTYTKWNYFLVSDINGS